MIDLASAFQFDITLSESHEQYEIAWKVPKNMPYFDGHFPGRPILPAVAIMDANEFILKKTQSQNFCLKKVINAKFSSPITPGLSILIQHKKQKDNSWLCEWKEMSSKKSLLQMTLVLEN